jgi:hypothetical protein
MKTKSYGAEMSADQITFTGEGHCFAFHLRNLSRGKRKNLENRNNYYNTSSHLKKGGLSKKDTKSGKNNNS